MTAVVADASALAEYLLRTTRAASVAKTIEAREVRLHVPALCDVEIASVLRSALLRGRLTETRALEALRDYAELPITRHGHVALLSRALWLRANLSAYDAVYIALAEAIGAVFLTADARLARAVRVHTRVEVLADVIR